MCVNWQSIHAEWTRAELPMTLDNYCGGVVLVVLRRTFFRISKRQ